jgi:hypothetical protein
MRGVLKVRTPMMELLVSIEVSGARVSRLCCERGSADAELLVGYYW